MAGELKQSILDVCGKLAKRGEYYQVHKFRYRDEAKRRLCWQLKNDGELIQCATLNPYYFYCRPADVEVINAALAKQAQVLKGIHAKNVGWHLSQAEKSPGLRDYHLKEAVKERELSL